MGTQTNGTEPTNKEQRVALQEQNAADQELAKNGVNLATLSGKQVSFQPETATEMWLLAQYFFAAKNCLPKTIGSVGDMFMKCMAARSLKIDLMSAIRGIDVVEGKIFIEGDLIHAILNTQLKREEGDWVELVESTAEGATYKWMKKGWGEPKLGTFDKKDASDAGLLEKQGPWKTYRKAMFRHRAMITWAREYFPEKFLGVYTNDELEEFREVNQAPQSGIIPATTAPTDIDTRPLLPAPAPKVRLDDAKPAVAVEAQKEASTDPQQNHEQQQPAAEQNTATKELARVLDLVGRSETADAFVAAFAHVQNLLNGEQAEARLALIRQIDTYLTKGIGQPTADLGKLIFRIISGLPEEQREGPKKFYARFTWPKAAK